jgi:hypothetical protein
MIITTIITGGENVVITVGINEDAHKLVIQKQNEIGTKTGIRLKIADIVSEAIKAGIDAVDDYEGLDIE